MKQVDITLVLPCYNESEHFVGSIEKIVDALTHTSYTWEIIFIEDKSTDLTEQIIKKFLQKQKSSQFKAIWHQNNEGRGKSVSDGIYAAKGKYVGFIDIDCEVSPVYMSECIRLLSDFDIVYGKRIYEINPSGLIRASASKLYSFLVKIVLQSQCKDTESGYKFFRREKILPILRQVEDTGWFWDTEIMVRSERAGLRIHGTPVLFARRKDKTSTVRLIEDTLDYIQKLWKFRSKIASQSSTI